MMVPTRLARLLVAVLVVAGTAWPALVRAAQMYNEAEQIPAGLSGDRERLSLYHRGHAALLQWDVREAATNVLPAALKQADEDPEAAYFLAHYYFMVSQYEKARNFLDMANGRDQRVNARFEPYLAAALRHTATYQEEQREHFVYRFAPGIDDILVDYADRALSAAWEALGTDLGHRPSEKIVVEFVTSATALGELTGLPEEAIHTTGTIAIAKFNRLIITTPRVTTMGYRWLDTAVHEYAHLVVCQVSRNRIPIWLHEGLAQLEEKRHRQPPKGEDDPRAQSLLARALRTGRFITLEQMHPSMALLPSKEDGALAYAEVLSMARFLYKLHGGYANISKLLREMRLQDDLDAAFRSVYGFDIATLERRWKQYLRSQNLRETDNRPGLDIGFRKQKSTPLRTEEEDDPADEDIFLGKSPGARYFRIGKLLKDRGRLKAAIAEFEKAVPALGPYNPLLQNAIASTWLNLENPAKAAASLEPLLTRYDGPALTYFNLGQAYLAMGQDFKAIEHLLIVVDINPFDPRCHLLLSDLYRKTGDSDSADREAQVFKRLSAYLQR